MNTRELVDTVTAIKKLIRWYQALKSGNFDLALVSEARRKLVGYHFFLAEETGKARRDFHTAYGKRKISEAREYDSLRKKKIGASDAAVKAKLHVEKVFEDEKAAESLYSYLYSIVDSAREVLDAMKQDIAMYREERRES